jgi:hypothetical protein
VLNLTVNDQLYKDRFCKKNEVDDIPEDQLEEHKALHANLLTEYINKNYGICKQHIDELMGKFGGEADSFYQTLLDRISAV